MLNRRSPAAPRTDKNADVTHWLLQCSPRVWDVFEWWENSDGELDDWTVARHLNRINKGDTFAFWIGGTHAGIYAVGNVTGPPKLYGRVTGGYWKTPPRADQHLVPLKVTRYLFDEPILKSMLIHDRDFADALIIRMPRAGNPIELTPKQWQAIVRRIDETGAPAHRPVRRTGGHPVVMSRALSRESESTTVASPAVERVRQHRESRLVANFEADLGRPLQVVWASLPGGDRIVADAYDPRTGTLIEAKASSSRSDIRMAVGQLLDYQHHLVPGAKLAILVPTAPAPDIAKWLRSLMITTIIGRI